MDRGVSGEHLPAPDRDVEEDSVPARHVAMDPDRLPLATPSAAKDPGLLEPQRTDFESWREEESVLRVAAVVSRVPAVITTDDTDYTERSVYNPCNPWQDLTTTAAVASVELLVIDLQIALISFNDPEDETYIFVFHVRITPVRRCHRTI